MGSQRPDPNVRAGRRDDHEAAETFFRYVYEPGGNRVGLCNPCARLIFAPDWATITWTGQERAKGQAWGLATIPSLHTHGTPPVG